MQDNKLSQRFWRFFTSSYKRLWVLAILALLLCFPIYYLTRIPVFKEIEARSYDLRFRLAPHPELADSSIVLVCIDQGSLQYAGQLGQRWPFPRSYYALICNYLAEHNAKAVIFDILFDQPDFYRGEEDPQLYDTAFAEAMQAGGNSFLAFSANQLPQTLSPSFSRFAYALPHALKADVFQGAQIPVEPFLQSAAGIGGINLKEGSDSVLRSIPSFYSVQGKSFPNLALAAFLHRHPAFPENHQTRQGDMPVFWYGKGGTKGVFNYLPFSALLYSAAQELNGRESLISPDYFAGKSVFIGASAAGLMDLRSSPYTWGIPGMELWATLLSNLNKGHRVLFPTPALQLLLVYLLILLMFIVISRSSAGYSPLLALLILILVLLASWAAFALSHVMLDTVTLLLAWVFSWLLIITLGYWAEGKHKRELRLIFSRYLHPDLVDRIASNPGLVQMGGEELSATVMFSDIYDFTTFSENHQAAELVSYLNEYFSTFTNTILDNNGMLDKFTGDGLMAVFGAPLGRSDHAICACRAALAHRRMSLEIAKQASFSPSEHFHLATRIGINSGLIVAGNIGSQRRMEYTSIGDPVNLASRLEGVNKLFGTHIIISESTYLLVKDAFIARELDYLKVKGKDIPTRIYELLGEPNEIEQFAWIKTYAAALELYRQADFAAALKLFTELADAPLYDPPALAMQKRCTALLKSKPEDWQPILVLEHK